MAGTIAANLAGSDPERKAAFKIAPGLVANGDAGLLRVVLENLLGNAWKFTSKQRQAIVYFGSAKADGEQVFLVRDNGEGFDMAYAAKLSGLSSGCTRPMSLKALALAWLPCSASSIVMAAASGPRAQSAGAQRFTLRFHPEEGMNEKQNHSVGGRQCRRRAF